LSLAFTPPDTQDQTNTSAQATQAVMNPAEWLHLARAAFTASTTYFDSGIRGSIINNLRQFQGQHPQGSKYLSDAYRGRSKFFRPKTRAMVRKNEAIAAEAFFSSMDVVSIKAQDEDDPMERASAEINKELLQYRLTTKGRDGIPWFSICIGAYQDAQVQGLVCSYQYWEKDERKGLDRPCVRLRPIENVRFDPNADWYDPVGTSPYFIDMIPMYVKDVKARMKTIDPVNQQPKWKPMDDNALLRASTQVSDIVRLQREPGRIDPRSQTSGINDYSIVWVHRNIVEVDGSDWVYHTLGTIDLLDTPRPIEKVWFHGQRPYVIGNCVLETHRAYPQGPVALVKDVQGELNENANQRLDNVKFAMNKRYFIKRSAQIDLRSLQRNVPSSATVMNDPEKDVKIVETRDVTRSAYEEQDRLNLDMDDLGGSFSQASVQANRALNETVGGMNILTKDASQITGYQLRTFAETWVEKVLEQLVLLEQFYETDAVILGIASKKANLYQRFGVDSVTDDLLMRVLTVTVQVGTGATNPHDQLTNFLNAMTALDKMLSSASLIQYGINVGEVIKEVFSTLGYRDGKRFFPDDDDPRIMGMQQTIQKLQDQLDQKMPPEVIAATVENLKAQAKKNIATAVKIGVESAYSAVQTAEVLGAVPLTATIADKVMQTAGYVPPTPAGVDPNYPSGAGPVSGLSVQPVKNIHTGMVFTPGAPGAPAAGDTSPQTPAAPATPGVGSEAGVNTMRPDGTR
jgi:hypothetical protein